MILSDLAALRADLAWVMLAGLAPLLYAFAATAGARRGVDRRALFAVVATSLGVAASNAVFLLAEWLVAGAIVLGGGAWDPDDVPLNLAGSSTVGAMLSSSAVDLFFTVVIVAVLLPRWNRLCNALDVPVQAPAPTGP